MRLRTAALAVVATATLAACGNSGTDVANEADTSIQTATTTGAPDVQVGAVPGNAHAATALRPWVIDVVKQDLGALTRKCWTVPPDQIEPMYGDPKRIVEAVANPGIVGQFATFWRSNTTEVSARFTEIDSNYACPKVSPVGSSTPFTDEDARYTVERYLARTVGRPVNVSDVEASYPLVCPNLNVWNPSGTGPTAPPLAVHPDPLHGATAFDPKALKVETVRPNYVAVTGPVTDASGATRNARFTLTPGTGAYCIGEIAR
ncbi:hypothetical protein [Antrihabitans cavernicola]|uniref:Sensor domain-containing protein n=1 Tax=Antrihabitans cavernicola TaxID=2495913 RepID=A0A5A7SJ78_9NOCA|nr:hypothetical protein [Spelaeibacter cavernicola]KAA0024683.1 hypothetical protein FOY51_01700 [Spelaeibacter cavernicola]